MKLCKRIARLLPIFMISLFLSACSACGEKVVYRTPVEADEETVKANAMELAEAIGWDEPDEYLTKLAEFVTRRGTGKMSGAFAIYSNYINISFEGEDGKYQLFLTPNLGFMYLEKDGVTIRLTEE
jgi:hypothetical protein